MPGTMSIDGIMSGLNTQDIIDKLVEMRRTAVKRLEDKQTVLTDKLSAWQDLNTRVLALRLKTDALANPRTFGAKTATSDNESILTATASSDAVSGIYYMKVKTVATAHQMQSQGYNDLNSVVGSGDVKITVDGKTTTVNLNNSNNTLVGLKDAINRAGAGVRAAIINVGGDTPFKLVVTSDKTGLANSMEIELPVEGLTGGETPTFTDFQTASDCTIELGSGAVQISKPSNNIDDLLPGVSIKVKSADIGKTVTLSVQPDNETVRKSIDEFIEQYNNIVSFMSEQFAYNQEAESTGLLFGDFSLMNVQMDLANMTTSPIAELSQNLKALTSIGIKTTVSGTLQLDETEFNKVMNESPDQIKAVFAAVGSTTDANISYVASTADTRATSAGYGVSISRIATQARITAGVAVSGTLMAEETLTINGKAITFDAGWDKNAILQAINSRSTELGVKASFTAINGQGTGDYLTITSNYYGDSPLISIQSSLSNAGADATSGFGNSVVNLGSAGGESGTGTSTKGVDVAGTIDGKVAEGDGQILKSTEGDSKGLRILVSGGALGNRGSVSFSRGVASQLSQYVTKAIDKFGAVGSAQETIKTKIRDIKDEISDLSARLKKKEEQLYQQFTDMETALSKLKSQGEYMASLFAKQ